MNDPHRPQPSTDIVSIEKTSIHMYLLISLYHTVNAPLYCLKNAKMQLRNRGTGRKSPAAKITTIIIIGINDNRNVTVDNFIMHFIYFTNQ